MSILRSDPINRRILDSLAGLRPLLENEKRWEMFLPEVFKDIAVLLMRPDTPFSNDPQEARYNESLKRLSSGRDFRRCSRLLHQSPRELHRAVIASIFRLIMGEVWTRVRIHGETITEAIERSSFELGPEDFIKIQADSRLLNGSMLLNYPLLDLCMRPWSEISEHHLETKRIPYKKSGQDDTQVPNGDHISNISLRPRLDDPWPSIIPTEWAVMKADRRRGVDLILNRHPLVFLKEQPRTLRPRNRALVMFFIDSHDDAVSDSDSPFLLEKGQTTSTDLSKSLAYRMIVDAARQIPRSEMSLDVALFVFSSRQRVETHNAAFFDVEAFDEHYLASADNEDKAGELLAFDSLVSDYFLMQHRPARRIQTSQHNAWAEAATANPFAFLRVAGQAVTRYDSTYLVVLSNGTKWDRLSSLLSHESPRLQARLPGSPVVLMVRDPRNDEVFSLSHASFSSWNTMRSQWDGALNPGNEYDLRNCFLDMIIGPVEDNFALEDAYHSIPSLQSKNELANG